MYKRHHCPPLPLLKTGSGLSELVRQLDTEWWALRAVQAERSLARVPLPMDTRSHGHAVPIAGHDGADARQVDHRVEGA